MSEMLHRPVYRSHSNIVPGDSPALRKIFDISFRNNQRTHITGALALPDGRFVQAIEGSLKALDALMVTLSLDVRHSDIVILGDWPITARLFAGRAMAHPDPTPLDAQSFRIITEDGSGAQCTGLLLGLMQNRAPMFSNLGVG